MSERSYWLGFSCFSGIGPAKFQLLLKEFESAKAAWNTDESSLKKVLGKALTPQFIDFRDKFSIPEYEQKLKKKKVSYLILTDKDYPELLKKSTKPPFVLYYRGNKEILNADKSIAIVGTRKITEYGKQVTQSLTTDLVNNGFVTVSGLALGVDATAHRTTIENKGKTIAVLGCGVDCVSPEENTALYDRIIESGGAIVSEYTLGAPPSKGSFPSRNRIIAGLSRGVLVTEGAADSGALYTAEDAFKNNRSVFAVPGPITSSLSKGPHGLIAKGGKLISSADDVIKDLGLRIKELRNPPSLKLRRAKGDNKDEQRIIDLLQNEDMHFDEIVRKTKIRPAILGTILSILEMRGIIKSLDGGFFSIIP